MVKKRNLLQKKTLLELKVIARKLGLTNYSKLNKEELISLIEEKVCWVDLFNIPRWIIVITPILGLAISYRTCSYEKESLNLLNAANCEIKSIDNFEENESFKIRVLDFNQYSYCSQKSDCEIQLALELSRLDSLLDITISLIVEKCSSQDLNLFTKRDFENFATNTNSDIVIYGSQEFVDDSVEICIGYALNQELKNDWILNKSDNFVLNGRSIRSLYAQSERFVNFRDIVLWNIAHHIIYQDTIRNSGKFRYILDQITEENTALKSMSFVLKGISYTKDLKVDSAMMEYNSAIKFDSINDIAYIHRGLLNLVTFNEERALNDIYVGELFRMTKNMLTKNRTNSTDLDTMSKHSHPKVSEVINELLNTIDEPLAFSLLLNHAYRPDLNCKLTLHYYNYMRKSIDYKDIKWYDRLGEIEDFVEKCN